MKVYVYIKDVKTDGYDEIEVRVFDTREKARGALKADRDDVIDYWKKERNTIEYDTLDLFIAEESGAYVYNHDYFSVEEREIE